MAGFQGFFFSLRVKEAVERELGNGYSFWRGSLSYW